MLYVKTVTVNVDLPRYSQTIASFNYIHDNIIDIITNNTLSLRQFCHSAGKKQYWSQTKDRCIAYDIQITYELIWKSESIS